MAKYKIIPSSRTIVQSPISIGHKAEKGVQAIEFDLTAWVETYGSGTLTVIMRRWGDEIPYPIALEIGEDNKATWTLSDIDTAKAGMAYAQLNYIVGDEVVKKSDIYTFRVMDSLAGEGEPPEAYESWLEQLTHLAAEAMAEVLDIEGIVTDKTLSVDGGIADAKKTGDEISAIKADLGDLENAIVDEVESASVTENISNTYNGVTFEYVDNGTLKLYGTATANRRFLCLNGQNSGATSTTAFSKTLEQGKYKITTGATGFLSANDNFAWQYTYTTFANAIVAVTKREPEATVELTQPAMVGFSFNSGCNFGTSENPTYVTISVEKVVSKLDSMLTKAEYDSTGIIMRGNVIALGYNSFADCTLPGLYTFTTANLASISDSPAGFNAGGILLTTINGSVVWQEIKSSFESFIRYGYTGTWQKSKKSLYVKYTSTASARDDKDVAQISVDIPTDVIGRKVRYEMGHCVDASKNADTWRLMYLYYVLSNGNANQMNRKGEFECAIHLANRPDFSGGVTHGDEIDQSVAFFVDGKQTLPENVSGFCDKFRVVRNALLYDPNDSTTPIAKHGCEYIFTKDGLTINQSVKWLVSEPLTNCFLAMLPIYKTYSTYRYDNTNFEVVENTDTNYSVTVPDATSVTEYNSDISTTMEIGMYPKGLSGGDCALITDNNGLNYNKVYFPVCTGGSSQIGDLWKATTKIFCR